MRRAILVLLLTGCSSTPSPYVAGFNPPPAPDGFTRYVTPGVLGVKPGDDLNNCQWIAPPAATDQLIVQTSGYQSIGGHHLTVYANKINEPVGTSRICTNDDMLNITFLGAVGGGEGNQSVVLPEGLGFQLPAGMALMANAHYINATPNVFDAQSVVDIKVAGPNDVIRPVGFLAVNWDGFSIPASTNGYTSTAKCTATSTLSFFMWANHMHEYGASMISQLGHSDGSMTMMANDPNWTSDKTFNPAWVKWDLSAPFIVNPGDVFNVACTWNNTTDAAIGFPREMCVASGFVLEEMPQAICEASGS